MDNGGIMTSHGGSNAEILRSKDKFSLFGWAVGLSLGKCSIWPIDELHSASELVSFLLLFLLYPDDLGIIIRFMYFKGIWVSWGQQGLIPVAE